MSPIKHNADSMQNSSSFPSQPKGKKRSRSDQTSESRKREISVKHNDGDSVQLRSDNLLKSEISKLAAKGLLDSDCVDKLVQLMQPDKSHKKMDLSLRSMLAGILAASERLDCLNLFVQRRGLSILDEWLKEVQKGKPGSTAKDGDKQVEDFLLVLLNALDKLPVNLNALQMCNIGKSVNHLRSHKNVEIHKKARSLVDTWKQRVEAEMNNNDAKSSSSPEVPVPANEISYDWKKHSSASSGQLSSPKSAAAKLVHGGRTSSASSGIDKSSSPPGSVNAILKQAQPKISEPPVTVREEKSSTSSQSHTNSQYSSEIARKSGKEDANSSTAGSRSMNRTSGASRHRKSANGLQVTIPEKESGASKHSTMLRSSASEKVSQSTITCENAVVKNSKMIIKIHNRGCSPGKSSTAGPVNEIMDKCDQVDAALKEKSTKCQTDALPEQCRTGNATITMPGLPEDLSTSRKGSEANTSTATADNPCEGEGEKQCSGAGPTSVMGHGTSDDAKEINVKSVKDSVTDAVAATSSLKAEQVVKEKTQFEEEETGDSSLPSISTKAAAEVMTEDISEVDAKMKQIDEESVAHSGENLGASPAKEMSSSGELEHQSSRNSGLIAAIDEKEDKHSSAAAGTTSGVPDNDKKLEFDLNKGFEMDEMNCGELIEFAVPTTSSCASAERVLFPPLKKNKTEVGFQPHNQVRPLLEIDLNVTDERIVQQDIISIENCGRINSSVLELDLNRVDEDSESGGGGQYSRDFDLNNGPVVDEKALEPFSLVQAHRHLPQFGIVSSKSSWDSPGTTYSAVTIATPLLPDRVDHNHHHHHPFPIIAPTLSGVNPGTSFNPDLYRGPALSSSPLQYPVFPFGTSSLPAAAGGGYMDPSAPRFYPPAAAIPAQFMGPSAAAQYLHMGGLDLNSGPPGTTTGLDIQGRDRIRQFSAPGNTYNQSSWR